MNEKKICLSCQREIVGEEYRTMLDSSPTITGEYVTRYYHVKCYEELFFG